MMILGAAQRPAGAAPLGINADWRFSESGDGETLDTFSQSYNMDFGSEVNEVIDYSGAVRYQRTRRESAVSEILSPTLGLALDNDVFRLDLSGNLNRRRESEGPNLTDSTWEATWTSRWRHRWWPSLRLFYGQDRSRDDLDRHAIDTESDRYGGNLDWTLGRLKAFYAYDRRENTDNSQALEYLSDSHVARVQGSAAFFGDRLTLSFAQQFLQADEEVRGARPAGQVVFLRVTVATALSGVDATPQTGTLASTPALIDGDRFSAAVTINPGDRTNIGARTGGQAADRLFLYTTDDISASAGAFQWDLYVSSDGNNWSLSAANLAFTYNGPQRRFEMDLPAVSPEFLKVVATATPATAVSVSEIEIFRRVVATGSNLLSESTNRSWHSDVSLGARLREDLAFSYSLSYEASRPDPGAHRDKTSQAGSLRWTPWGRYFSSTLGASETRDQRENDPDTTSRSYSLTLASTPLDTLDLGASVTRSDSLEDGRRIGTSYHYGLLASAEIYPDLHAGLDVNYSTAENLESDTTTRTLNGVARLTARLTPAVLLDGSVEHNRTDGSGTESRESIGVLNLTWRPSDIVSVRWTGRRTWTDQEEDANGWSVTLGLAPTRKVQINGTYTYQDAATTSESFGLSANWNISRFFLFQASGSYQILPDEEPWQVGAQLTARFSGL
ncbi:hypothetical protein HCU62_03215 [Dissulfurirhabdus thermomarina]|uniref:hypothetical protein n=1 Tax=Dissulfurirhabdus thermomarina TaxID=1765737 RepID=UPI0014703EC3|nr:hypothetical protein [Dissulfurirhabdus thermomarina]NMX22951.1 hypothetical protein [Dissulfurirhabdus thermomarina]